MTTKRSLLMLFALISMLGSLLPATASASPAPAKQAAATAPRLAWSASPLGPSPTSGAIVAMYGPPEAQTWGWCGVITKEKKVIRTFKKKGGAKVTLFCGGPKYSSKPQWGLRHITARHMRDWENKSAGTFQTWRQVADIGMAATLADPAVRGKIKAGKHCYSRVVYLWDVQRQRVIGTMIVKVIWRADGDRRIITAYPSNSHCDIR